MKLRTALIVVLLLFASVPLAVARGMEEQRAADRARGLVYRGLERARPDGPCKKGWEMRLPNGAIDCTHGPDPAPPGHDVTKERSLEELAAVSGEANGGSSLAPGDVYCDGDGVSGNRVQALYAYPAAGPNNYSSVAPYIRLWAAAADRAVNDSAAKTGGVRHVRWVTQPDCRLDVVPVPLSSSGIASLSGTVSDLAAQGLNRADRKYLVWVDAYVYCGVANVSPDDRPSQDNQNNGPGRPGMVARVDRGCWGNATSPLEVHELVHTLGGVQTTAPNGAGLYHCSDESDVMCYDDDGTRDGYVTSHGQLVPLRSVCPSREERLLDCGGDDYFSTSPESGSWLSKHWNVADSSFLTSEGEPTPTDTTAPWPTRPQPTVVGRLGGRVSVRVSWRPKDADVAGYWLWESVDGRSWHYVERTNLWERSADLHLRRGHRYRYIVHAFDAAGNYSPAVAGPSFKVKVREERSPRIVYSGRWHRLYRSSASARHLSMRRSRRGSAHMRFRGRSVAWVSSRGPNAGRARVYVDGRFAARVDLHSATATSRVVVFSRRWASRRLHRIVIRPIGGSHVPVDALVFLR